MEKLVPGNYFLTKSMDWATKSFAPPTSASKIELGDYWYLKKFLVYYSYIFSNQNDMETVDFFKNIEDNFNKFISSLDENLRDDAEKYFYYRDIRNIDSVIGWNDFYDLSKQPRIKEKLYEYKVRAKKIYWMYLMGIGGQSGQKKYILHECVPAGVKYHELGEKLQEKYGEMTESDINGQLNDVSGPLRNMRQLFYYYGIFYTRESNKEEFSLTTIGQILMMSNIKEIAIIMEHQKLRMISQPPNAKIDKVKDVENYNNFFLELNPYNKILKYLSNYNSLSRERYQYVLSRNIPMKSDIETTKEIIQNFNRKRDNKTEDYSKELKKYLHGLPLIRDIKKNIEIGTDWEPNDAIQAYYTYINFYKKIKKKILGRDVKRYKEILLRNYIDGKNIKSYHQLKDWYIYISSFDKALLFTLLIYNWNGEYKEFQNIIKYLNIDVPFINKIYGEKEKGSMGFDIFNKYNEAFVDESDEEIVINNMSTKFNIHSVESLVKVSDRKFDVLEAKKRKQISIIKSFYQKENIDTCDCCGQETFITKNNVSYLEYHHLVPLSQEGTDHVLNIFGICPMCHRKFHFSRDKDRVKMYDQLSQNDNLVKIDQSSFSLFNRYKYLYKNGQISLLGLEFLEEEKVFTEEQITDIITSQ